MDNIIITEDNDNITIVSPEVKIWTCRRCGHESSSKCNLLKHLRRKTPCIDTNNVITIEAYIQELLKREYNEKTYDCQFCGTKFNAYQNRHRHYKTCKEAKKQNKENIIKELQEENNRLKEQLNNHILPQSIVNNIINNNTINITINNFGNEDTSHLTHDLLSHCLFNPSKGLPKLIDNIHYNPNVPSNFNLRHKSTKNNLLEKYENEHWMECDTSNTLDELIRKGYRILNTHYTEYYMNDPDICENEIKQRALERFRFLSDKTCNEYHSVKRDLRLLIKDRTMYLVESPEVV
jgi:transcription elongation factor Elf1